MQSAETLTMVRCRGNTSDGSSCRNHVSLGSEYCRHHIGQAGGAAIAFPGSARACTWISGKSCINFGSICISSLNKYVRADNVSTVFSVCGSALLCLLLFLYRTDVWYYARGFGLFSLFCGIMYGLHQNNAWMLVKGAIEKFKKARVNGEQNRVQAEAKQETERKTERLGKELELCKALLKENELCIQKLQDEQKMDDEARMNIVKYKKLISEQHELLNRYPGSQIAEGKLVSFNNKIAKLKRGLTDPRPRDGDSSQDTKKIK